VNQVLKDVKAEVERNISILEPQIALQAKA
jgi:hypothetical protein